MPLMISKKCDIYYIKSGYRHPKERLRKGQGKVMEGFRLALKMEFHYHTGVP